MNGGRVFHALGTLGAALLAAVGLWFAMPAEGEEAAAWMTPAFLATLALAGFSVSAAIESKRRKAGLDALARVELAVQNSEHKRFTFHDESRSVTISAARAVIAIAEYFVNAERAFVTLFHARKDALQRGRPDLVARYTAELAEVVKSTSYAAVIESPRKELT